MQAEEEAVEFAQRTLAEGHGLDAILTAFEKADLSTFSQIGALRSVTGLGLQEATWLRGAFENGLSLAHVNQHVLQLLRAIPHLGGKYGHWIRLHFFDAVLGQKPWLTLIPGSRDPALGSIRFWTQEAPGEVEDKSYGSLGGPGVDFDGFRAEMQNVIRIDSFFQRHATVIQDTREIATYRFSFD
jgi:hypothetical protein